MLPNVFRLGEIEMNILNANTRSNARSTIAAACASVMFLCSASALHAEEQELYYTLTAIEDVSYGEDVVAGDYDVAIEGILSSAKVHRGSFAAQTNLCVAYTRSGDFEKADVSCDAALVALTKRSRPSIATGIDSFKSRRVREKYLALALSNRGVLRAVTGKAGLARRDFVRATELKFSLDVADVNLARLGKGNAENAAQGSDLQES